MEPWQEKHITDNLSELLNTTTCSPTLVTQLEKFISKEEIEELTLETRINTHRASILYKILPTRSNSYNDLMKALYDKKQTKAYDILLAGMRKNRSQDEVTEFEESLQVKTKTLTVMKTTIPKLPKYYVTRHMSIKKTIISPNIFKSSKDKLDIFLVSGVQKHQLVNLVGGEHFVESTSQLREVDPSCQIIQLKSEDHYETICKNIKLSCPNRHAHWLTYNGKQLTWSRSRGSIHTVQQHVYTEEQELLNENVFVEECLKSKIHACISGSPGMGKSTLLARIGEIIRAQDPSYVVHFISLPKLIPMLPEKAKRISFESLTKAIALTAEINSEDKVDGKQKMVIMNLFKSADKPCFLLLDGYDEMQTDQANAVLNCLMEKENIQLYVTTRSNRKPELERVLGSLGFEMLPFKEENQVSFLAGYWSEKLERQEAEYPKLEKFAGQCLAGLKGGEKEEDDDDRDIAGNPFICRLLAENEWCLAKEYLSPESTGELQKETELPSSTSSVFSIYREYVENALEKLKVADEEGQGKKKEKIWTRTLSRTFSVSSKKPSAEQDAVTDAHKYYALELLFPKDYKNCSKKSHQELLAKSDLLEAGDGTTGKLRFVHRTFAEYLVALFIVDSLRANAKDAKFEKFLFHTALANKEGRESFWKYDCAGMGSQNAVITCYTFDNYNICYFLDSLLKKEAPEAGALEKLKPRPNFLKGTYSASVKHDFHHLAKLIKDIFFTNLKVKTYPGPNLLLVGAKHGGVATNQGLIAYLKDAEQDPRKLVYPTRSVGCLDAKPFPVTPLHVALQRGDFHVAQALLNEDLQSHPEFLTKLAHVCVAGSCTQPSKVVKDKIEILQLFKGKPEMRRIFEEQLADNRTPILLPNIHFDLLDWLMGPECCADVNGLTGSGDSLLHISFRQGRSGGMSPAQLRNLVERLSVPGKFSRFKTSNALGQTALHIAVENVELDEDTLELLATHSDINACDEAGNSVLFSAVAGGRSGVLISQLITQGANLEHTNHKQETVLHVAALTGNAEAVDYLLGLTQHSLLHQLDEEENNALHAAVAGLTSRQPDIQTMLIEAGIELNKLNSQGLSPFVAGMKSGKRLQLRVIQLMEQKGFQLSPQERSEGLYHLLTGLNWWEWNPELVAVAEHLLASGAVVEWHNVNDPWEKQNIEQLGKATVLSDELAQNLRAMKLITEDYEVTSTENLDDSKSRLYEVVKSCPGSYERLMVSLVKVKQQEPFHLLKQTISSSDFLRFVTPPPGLIDFMERPEPKVLVLLSDFPDRTLVRLRTLNINPKLKHEELSENWEPAEIRSEAAGDITTTSFVTCSSSSAKGRLGKLLKLKNVVCIVHNCDTKEVLLEEEDQEGILQFQDEFKWEDLTIPLQNRLTSKFRNKAGSFSRLVELVNQEIHTPLEDDDNNSSVSSLRQLPPKLTKTALLKAAPRNVISDSIFDSVLGELLVFTDIKRKELATRIKWGQSVAKSSGGDHLVADYIVQKEEDDFGRICRDVQNAHLLEYEEGTLKLVKSQGRNSQISRHIEADSKASKGIFQFLPEVSQNVVKVVKVPDPFHLIQMLKAMQKNGSTVVLMQLSRLHLSFSNYFDSAGRLRAELAYDVITDLLGSEDAWEGLFLKGSVELVLHLHEIRESELSTLRQLASLLARECRDISIWLTTSATNALHTLEGAFGVSGYEILQIPRKSQIQLITDMWRDSPEQQEKAQTVLSTIWGSKESKLKSITGKLKDTAGRKQRFDEFAGMILDAYNSQVLDRDLISGKFRGELWDRPHRHAELVTFLIGKCFREEAKVFTKLSESKPLVIPSHVSLIAKCVATALSNGANACETALSVSRRIVALCFPEWKDVFAEFEENSMGAGLLTSLGIAQPWRDSYVFPFDEFVYYFIALLFVDPAASAALREDRLAEVLRLVLFSSRMVAVRLVKFSNHKLFYYFDALLEEKGVSYFSALFAKLNVTQVELSKLFRNCVIGSYLNILKVVEKRVSPPDGKVLVDAELVGEGAKFANLETLKYIFDLYKTSGSKLIDVKIDYKDEGWPLVKLAVFRGNYSVVKYLVELEEFKNTLSVHELLVVCCKDSHFDSKQVIEEKVKIVELLMEGRAGVPEFKTIFTTAHTHVILLKKLLSYETDAAQYAEECSMMLQLVVSYLTPKEFHDLVTDNELISSEKFGTLNLSDAHFSKVPSVLIQNLDVLPETVDALTNKGMNFKLENPPCSLLQTAVEGQRSAGVIAKLIEIHPEWTVATGESLLHEAAEIGNLSAIRVLISKGVDVNCKDSLERTPLHHALRGEPKSNLLETVRLLMACSAEVKAVDKEGLGPMDYAVIYNKSPNVVKAVQLLSQSDNMDISSNLEMDRLNNTTTPESVVSPEEFHELIEFLVNNSVDSGLEKLKERCGSSSVLHRVVSNLEVKEETLKILLSVIDINAKDEDGETVLFAAIAGGRSFDFMDMLVRNGADPQLRNSNEDNVLHKAAISDHMEALTYFISRGVDINEKNAQGKIAFELTV